MANDTITTLDKLLDYMIEPITDAVLAPDDRPILALFQRIPQEKVYGRGLAAYFPMSTYSAGGFSVVAEEGEFPAPKVSVDAEGKLNVIKEVLSFGISDESIKAMAGGRKKLHTTLERILKGGLATHKARQECLAFGRGDGHLFRGSNTNYATSVTQYTSTVPIRAVEGDEVILFGKRKANTRITNTAMTVTSIDHENLTVDFSTSPNQTLTAYGMGYYKGTTADATIGTDYVYGLEAHLDSTTGSTVAWDAQDSATKQNVETYMNLGRSSNTKMRVGIYNASGATASLTNLQIGPSMCMAKGCKESNMVAIMNVKQFRRIAKLFSGLAEIKQMDIQLPGGKMRLPVIAGAGLFQLPVIQSYYFPDGFIAYVDKSTFVSIGVPGEWVKQGGSRMILMPGTSAYTDVYHMYYRSYRNHGCVMPYRSTVTKGLSTS